MALSPAAALGDTVSGTDQHAAVLNQAVILFAYAFDGRLVEGSTKVRIKGQPAATVGCKAVCKPHNPGSPLAPPFPQSFVTPPSNTGSVVQGSVKVRINTGRGQHQPAARDGDPVKTCDESSAAPVAVIRVSQRKIKLG